MVAIEMLSATLKSIAAPGMTPKALRAAVREKHPEASKKDVVRAAFYALTEAHGQQDSRKLSVLYDFALAERAPDDEPSVTITARRARKRSRASERAGAAV
ncbi:hypothetical protein ACRAWG_38245 [Methylobacterium sp. P31]